MLFDLDGTLVDTNYLHTVAWARAFADVGEWVPMNAIHRLVGMGGDQLVSELLGHGSQRAVRARSSRYRELLPDARAFPGAADLVRAVKHEGLAAVVATSSPADELDVVMDLLSIGEELDAITTADDVRHSKPSPEVFCVAMDSAGLDPARTVAVGDSVWDVKAARSAGIACIAVETGGFSRHELNEVGALNVFGDVQELLRQLHATPLVQLASDPTRS